MAIQTDPKYSLSIFEIGDLLLFLLALTTLENSSKFHIHYFSGFSWA
jgi:hypothetical protein